MDFSARAATKDAARTQAPPVLYATALRLDSTCPGLSRPTSQYPVEAVAIRPRMPPSTHNTPPARPFG